MLKNLEKYFVNKKSAIFISIICMFLWGSAFPMIKMGYAELNIVKTDFFGQLYFAGARFFVAGVLVFIYFYLLERKILKYEKGMWKIFVLLGILQTAGQYFFFYIAVSHTTGVKASVLQASATFFTVVLAHFFFKNDSMNLRKIGALALGFSGIIVVNIGSGFDWNFTFLGEGFMLISSVLSAFGNIAVKKYGANKNSFLMACGQFVFGGSLLFLAGCLGLNHPINFTPFGVVILLYGSFISSTAFVLWYMLLKYQPVGEISIYRLFIPVFGAILSALILPEGGFTIGILIGLVLVILGMLILNLKKIVK